MGLLILQPPRMRVCGYLYLIIMFITFSHLYKELFFHEVIFVCKLVYWNLYLNPYPSAPPTTVPQPLADLKLIFYTYFLTVEFILIFQKKNLACFLFFLNINEWMADSLKTFVMHAVSFRRSSTIGLCVSSIHMWQILKYMRVLG